MYNIYSLLFGLLAWFVPLFRFKKIKAKYNMLISFTCMGSALWFQLLEISWRVNIPDFSAVMDTIGAVVYVSVILIVGTVIMNLISINQIK